MKINKKSLIFLISFFSILSILYLSFRISVNIIFPHELVSTTINETFKNSFGKAIKFDSLDLNYQGDIILHNFYLSNSIDFNDNINLIKCDKVVIDTSIISLIKGELKICGFKFYSPLFTIEKSYGKSYEDTFREIFHLEKKENRLKFLTDGKLTLSFRNSEFSYKEVFKNTKTSIDFYNIDIDAECKDSVIHYSADGSVKNKNRGKNYKGQLFIEGKINIDTLEMENKSEFNRFDISYLNDFIKAKKIMPLAVKGALSGTAFTARDKENFHFKGNFQTSELNASSSDRPNPRQVISNENLNSSIEYSIDSKGQITVSTFNIDDGVLKLTSNGSYSKGKKLNLEFKTNSVDLAQFSENVNPFYNYNFRGLLYTEGKLSIDLKKEVPDQIAFTMDIKKFNMVPKLKNIGSLSVTDCDSQVKLDSSKIAVKSKFKLDESDFNLDFSSAIKKWNPFQSESTMDIVSKNIELSHLKKMVVKTMSIVYRKGFIDMYKGYDQSFFQREPEGIFLNNNDIKINLNSSKLTIAGKAALKNLAFSLDLKKGSLRTDNFSIDGYGGKYSLNVHANLRQDYPFVKMEGDISDLDLGALSGDAGSSYNYSGLMNADLSYDVNAYRIGHFVQNGKGEINLSIKNGSISGSERQKRLTGFLSDNGYTAVDLHKIEFSTFSIGFKQAGFHFYIKNFGLRGETLNFQTYGKYIYNSGLKIPLDLAYTKADGKRTRVPLLIHKEIEAPCIKINSRKKNEEICF